jgi:26S proteasome regulatory subunit N5
LSLYAVDRVEQPPQIYLEVQRARITRMLAHIKETEDHDIPAASDLFQDLQVETFGSMDRREKVDFVLEQMRLLRLKEDWDKLGITSKTVNIKWISEPENQDLKLRFYGLMIQYALHENKHLDVCKYYRAVFDTPSIQEDQAKWQAALRNAVYFIVLAPYDNEQSDLLARMSKEDKLPKLPDC